MRKIVIGSKSFPVFLLLLCILSYGILIPSLGFYWDDWPMAWFAHTTGPLGFFDVFEGDRPFLAGIYVITTALLDTIPYQWQILGLISRWLTSLTVWWMIRKLWPDNPQRAGWIAALFAVFPGFKQQPISIVYSNGFFLLLAYIASLGLNILALRDQKRYKLLTALALASYAICTFSTEYYLGLEVFRGFLIYLVVSETGINFRKRILLTAKHWLPYIALLSIFLAWRVLIFKFPTYQPQLVSEIAPSPLRTVVTLLFNIFQDSFEMGWLAWASAFRFPEPESFRALSTVAFWALALVSFLLSLAYLLVHSPRQITMEEKTATNPPSSPGIVVITGLVGLFFAGWPFWIANLPIELQFPYDRFGLAFMLGSSIFLVGLIESIIRTHPQKIIVLSMFLSMAVGANFEEANHYRRDWAILREMLWQLSWRAPALEPGTLLLTYGLPFTYYSDNSLTAPINWTFAPENKSLDLPYYLAFTDVRLGGSIPSFDEGKEVIQGYRNATYTGSTSQALVFFYSPPGCVWVIDPARDQTLPVFPSELTEPMKLSHLSQISPEASTPAQPPAEIFGSEPEHTWCYYFEKAELARQQENWEQIINLGDEAFARGLSTSRAQELLVFIEGYARMGNWLRAIDLANLAYDTSKDIEANLCASLHSLKDQIPPKESDFQNLQVSLAVFGCPAY
ncbi:MAG: hypothetical protein HPY59_11315 [Anaerolineae bacterium]|nr:hypothetical protein [Anaerolineae bacterium]